MARALALLIARARTPTLFHFTAQIGVALNTGQSLSQALAQAHVVQAPPTLLALISAGEINGTLPAVLARIVHQRQHDAAWRAECRKRASYPLFLLSSGSLIALALLTYVVPSFAQLYAQQQRALPTLTEQLLILSAHATHLTCAFVMLASTIATLYWQRHRRWVSSLWVFLPIIGTPYRQSCMLDVLRLIQLGHGTPQPLDRFIEQLLPHYQRRACLHGLLTTLARGLHQGDPLSHAFTACRIGQKSCLPDTQYQWIVLGEQSGTLSELLVHAIDALERDINAQMTRLNQWIEPVLMVTLAVGIGIIMLGMYLPVFDMGAVSW